MQSGWACTRPVHGLDKASLRARQSSGVPLSRVHTACPQRRQVVIRSLSVDIPYADDGRTFHATFPHMGSGLLFARSTGLKVWPAARCVTQLLLSHMPQVLEHHPHLSGIPSWTLCGKVCVELGAGLGLVSMAAAASGAQVIATDGDADLVPLLRKNLALNWKQHALMAQDRCSGGVHPSASPPRAALLPWGDAPALAALGLTAGGPSSSSPSAAAAADVVVMADVIYGSNPGVWERLVTTLGALSGPHTLIIQAESRRIEGLLYQHYWDALEGAGFKAVEVDLQGLVGGHGGGEVPGRGAQGTAAETVGAAPLVRCWVVHRTTGVSDTATA